MTKSLLFLIGLVAMTTAKSAIIDDPYECMNVMEYAGLSPRFAQMVAHAIHSLTVEDINYYFEETTTVENNIPTVNRDLSVDEPRLLPSAPLANYATDFTSMGMKMFDLVMRNMGQHRWGTSNEGVLERIDHAMHMSEIWSQAGEQYKVVQRLLDPQSDICSCVTDIEQNDVLNHLNLVALKIRYPGITSGNITLINRYLDGIQDSRSKRSVPGFSYSASYSAHYGKQSGIRPDFESVDFGLPDEAILELVATELEDGDDPSMTPLDSAESWQTWRQMNLDAFEDSGYFDLAVFMFCMLN